MCCVRQSYKPRAYRNSVRSRNRPGARREVESFSALPIWKSVPFRATGFVVFSRILPLRQTAEARNVRLVLECPATERREDGFPDGPIRSHWIHCRAPGYSLPRRTGRPGQRWFPTWTNSKQSTTLRDVPPAMTYSVTLLIAYTDSFARVMCLAGLAETSSD
jgi:hypothetical protein